ncbi:conserved protein of unknown function [Pseudodesulfovibrio profundus]|uniref:PD-(D/E)XK endonuclease-like domain-containing protein n=1 Tax=Pseudodesulfovibrio profundus TaxID=57320 RepID=A0A2C8FCT7_9BACT|nr:hypothetical protein [Pseudodesulfovibrio profundus]SOB59980.1 conserved protein of unknown function [Pseudodesulfovibrio profundus]
MQHDNTKSHGLLRLLTQGFLVHAEKKTASELGDRSKYIGMSDIGKGMECMRSAVASKLGLSGIPAATAVGGLAPDDVARTLERQITLQRGHWQEHGIEKALLATGVKLLPQLEICIVHSGVPIKAHLDFTLVWGGLRPAVRILELKSNARIPESLYASYEAQLYGQVGLLKSCWSEPCFSVPETELKSVTFPQAIQSVFNVALPESSNNVDIEAWVLSISLSEVRPFGPYLPDQAMLEACLQTAVAIWRTAGDMRAGNLELNALDYCQGFHPLCDWCDVNADCPKFQAVNIPTDSACGLELEELAMLKKQKTALEERIAESEKRIRQTYHLVGGQDWISTGDHRFRVVTVAGRRTLDRSLVADKLISLIGDELKTQSALEQCEKEGKPHERLYISKINKPLKSAA